MRPVRQHGQDKRLKDARCVLVTLRADRYVLDMAVHGLAAGRCRSRFFGVTCVSGWHISGGGEPLSGRYRRPHRASSAVAPR